MNETKLDLPETLRNLIDNRLDMIERMLLRGDTPRLERRSILDDIETQILDMLSVEAAGHEPSRHDLLRVLARLEPPEAFAAERVDVPKSARPALSCSSPPSLDIAVARPTYSTVGILACINGLVALILLAPASFALMLMDDALFGMILTGFVVIIGVAAMVLGILYAVAINQSRGRLRGLTCAAIGLSALPLSAFFLLGGFLISQSRGHWPVLAVGTLICILAVVGAIHLTYRVLELLVGNTHKPA